MPDSNKSGDKSTSYESAKAQFLQTVREAVKDGMTISQVLAHVPHPRLASQQLTEAGFATGGAIDIGYATAVRNFIHAYQSAVGRGAPPEQILAALPNPKLARTQLKLAGILR